MPRDDGKEITRHLAALGGDLNAKSPEGITAAQVAKVRGFDHIADFLVSKGAAAPEPFDASAVVSKTLEEVTSKDAPGIAVLVARDGKVLFSSGFGMADLSNDVPITPATKFRIGSVTKQFAAAAILKLQEEGKLNVTEVMEYPLQPLPQADGSTGALFTHIRISDPAKPFKAKFHRMGMPSNREHSQAILAAITRKAA